jgi:hypothetical protein
MADTTIVYYTANYDVPALERNVRALILENSGGLPIVSVSQRPIDFGRNICVGEVGRSGQNVYRQMLIGARAAETHFVCITEADELYPREYFQFRPEREDCFYCAEPLYVLFAQRGIIRVYARKPYSSESCMHCSRELLVNRLEQCLSGLPEWGMLDTTGEHFPNIFGRYRGRIPFVLPTPVITIKTDRQMHRRTPHAEGYLREVPYWGIGSDVVDRFTREQEDRNGQENS